MPILIFVLGVPTTVAIGTNLVQIIITGSVGTFVKSLAGHVDPVMVVLMLVAASAGGGSQLGAAASRIVEASRIRVLYGVIVLAGSVAVALEQASKIASSEFLSNLAAVVLLGVSGSICLVIAAMLVAAQLGKPYLQRAVEHQAGYRGGQDGGPGPDIMAAETRHQDGDN